MTALKLQRESEALLLCARAELIEEQCERLRAIVAGSFDWDYFYRLTRRHSLVPLAYRPLEHSIKDIVPPDILQRFRKDYQENAARNLIFVDELTSLLDTFAATGIEAILFKGPALAVFAYGDLNLRRFVDLDLIVRRQDMERAIAVLMNEGYVASKDLSGEQHALLLRTQHNLQFTRGRVIVELHWQVSSELFASSVTAEELWKNVGTLEINGAKLKTLATEDLLFALCVHGSRHLWQRLAWICDIDRIIRKDASVDWPALCERAKRAKAERMFLLGPALASKLLATQLPQSIGTLISRDRHIGPLCGEIQSRLFDGPEQMALPLTTVFRFNLLIRSDWRSRIRYGRFLLAPTDSDLEVLRLSPVFHFVYYLLRPFRLLHSTLRQH